MFPFALKTSSPVVIKFLPFKRLFQLSAENSEERTHIITTQLKTSGSPSIRTPIEHGAFTIVHFSIQASLLDPFYKSIFISIHYDHSKSLLSQLYVLVEFVDHVVNCVKFLASHQNRLPDLFPSSTDIKFASFE